MYSLIEKVREINPLVLHYTNNVTITDCANITLAIGASPLMSFSYEELDEIVSVASSVVINIGTMNSNLLDLYLLAGKAANKYNKPIILDPVGVFATKARRDITNRLLNEVKFDVVKGNISEIKYVGGFDVRGKGVDSFDDEDDVSDIAIKVAKKLECVVVATGKVDTVTNGHELYKIHNGSMKLKGVTGTGCMTTSLIASFMPCSESILHAATLGTLVMSLSGELADGDNPNIGTFKMKLFDEVNSMDVTKLEEYANIEKVSKV